MSCSDVSKSVREFVLSHPLIKGAPLLGIVNYSALARMIERRTSRICCKTVNIRVSVLTGTGGEVISEVVELIMSREDIGADGVVVLSSHHFKMNNGSIYRYYPAVAKSTKLPVIIYNFPDRTSVNLSPDFVLGSSGFDEHLIPDLMARGDRVICGL